MIRLLLFLALFLWPALSHAQTCDNYAAPTGSGTTCTQGAPCTISTWLDPANGQFACGKTLCLQDGKFQGDNQRIILEGTLHSCADTNRFTIRAENDGEAWLDGTMGGGQFRQMFDGHGPDGFNIIGLNISSSGSDGGALSPVAATTGHVVELDSRWSRDGVHDPVENATFSRVCAWDAKPNASARVWMIAGEAAPNDHKNVLYVDICGSGTGAKIFATGASQGNNVTVRRAWFRFEGDGGAATPPHPVVANYAAENNRWENNLWTFTLEQETTTSLGQLEDAFENVDLSPPTRTDGITIEGTIIYIDENPGPRKHETRLFRPWASNHRGSNALIKDLAFFRGPNVPQGAANALCWDMQNGDASNANQVASDFTCVNANLANAPNICQANWGCTDTQESATLGGVDSIWDSDTGARICHRIENGVNTGQPLWPWPMNQRIIDATTDAVNSSTHDVTAKMEELWGTIPAVCRTVTNTLVGEWLFNGNTLDTSGLGNNGVFSGGTADYVTGLTASGQALDFNATTEVVAVPSDASFADPTTLTYTGWINADTYGGQARGRIVHLGSGPFFSVINDTGAEAQTLRLRDERWSVDRGEWAPPPGSIQLGTTYFVAVSYATAGPTVQMYIDGQPVTTSTLTPPQGTLSTGTGSLFIGNNADGGAGIGAFDGRLDDVRVYNRILTPTEVLDLYNQGLTGGTRATFSNGTWRNGSLR